MDDKVNVSIEKIENGFILRRSWQEKKEGAKDGCCNTEYKSEEHFMKELPDGLSKYMVKGKLGDEPVKDFNEAQERGDMRMSQVDEHEKKKDK